VRAIRYCLSVVRRAVLRRATRRWRPMSTRSAHSSSPTFRASTSVQPPDNAPHTSFRDSASQARFEVLRSGTDAEFLKVADALAADLLNEMSHVNSKAGVLVCVTLEGRLRRPGGCRAQTPGGAGPRCRLRASRVGGGTPRRGGEGAGPARDLQKDWSFPTHGPRAQQWFGDKANAREARYFLLAMGLEAEEKAKAALGIVANAVVESVQPSERPRVLAQLKAAEPGELQSVVDAAVADATLTRPTEDNRPGPTQRGASGPQTSTLVRPLRPGSAPVQM